MPSNFVPEVTALYAALLTLFYLLLTINVIRCRYRHQVGVGPGNKGEVQLPLRVEEMATEMEARRLAQDVALAVQAALLARTAPLAVFAAFCDSRIGGHWGYSFGSLNAATAFDAIIDRARPH